MATPQNLYNKNRLFALAVLVLLVILIIFLIWWWFFRPAPEQVQNTNQINENVNTVVLPPQIVGTTTPSVDAPVLSEGEVQVITLARNFAERYGSWSTDSPYQNLRDLMPVVTGKLKKEFEKTLTSSTANTEYKGATTAVVNIKVDTITADKATVTVSTQRVETNASLAETVSYHPIVLGLVKQGGYWYVDTATWK